MTALQTIVVAFSMFSALPMPRVQWNGANMRYSLCAFPLVGAVIGGLVWLWTLVSGALSLPAILRGAGCCLIPVLVTGGIHLDGYIDTWDALASHGAPERLREILKDPHVGAFAVIRLGAYYVASLALWTALPVYRGGAVLAAFCLSRTLSGLAVASFPIMEGNGLARTFSEASARRRVRRILTAAALVLSALMIWRGGAVMVPAALGVFAYYRYGICRKFGGLSGDLAGWFLQTTELVLMFFHNFFFLCS